MMFEHCVHNVDSEYFKEVSLVVIGTGAEIHIPDLAPVVYPQLLSTFCGFQCAI